VTASTADRAALSDLAHRYASGIDDGRFDDVVTLSRRVPS
jgi:hypothetical protein